MVELRENPAGIDKVIERIQKKIHEPLLNKWSGLTVFGRVYKKTKKDGSISLETCNSKGEYKKVLFSEGNKIFFVQGKNPKVNHGIASNDLWIVCSLRLEGNYDRNDEQAHIDLATEVSKVLNIEEWEFEYEISSLKRVVEDSYDYGNFKFGDIHPYHIFMMKVKVDYAVTINKC